MTDAAIVAIPVYFDYASSLCAIAWQVAGRLQLEVAVRIDWRPLHIAAQHRDLVPGRMLDRDSRARIERVAQETDVQIRTPDQWTDSRAALEGAVFAEVMGCAAAYHEGVFRAAYELGEDIADRHVLVRVAAAAGLPIGDFMEFVATRRGAARLAAHLAEAESRNISGYPAFLLGDFPLIGIQPLPTMRLLVERYLQTLLPA